MTSVIGSMNIPSLGIVCFTDVTPIVNSFFWRLKRIMRILKNNHF